MGAVYEATDQLLHRHVALKIMLPEVAARAQNRNRFLREARAAASVEHDHICPIYQVGDDNGSPYIAMPLLVGETLESRIRQRRLNHLEIIDVTEQVAKGLSAAHQVGLIHRDIKPANVWLEKRKDGAERVRLLDFGLAQMETDEPGLTQPGSIMGTPSYMSPEQARGEAVDARTDLFSVGAMLYELLTGKKAFEGKTPTSVISSILVDKPVAPKIVDARCPECLSELTMRLLEKDPHDRLNSSTELSRELSRCRDLLNGRQNDNAVAVHQPVASAPLAATMVMSTPTVATATHAERSRTRWLWPLVTALALGGTVFAGLFIFQTSTGTLVVDASDDARLLFEKGELHVLDETGKMAYRLSARAPSEQVQPGKYHVEVVGADGLTLSTNEFVISRGEKTVLRVQATPPKPEEQAKPKDQAKPETLPSENRVDAFRGKAIFATDFEDPKQWPIPLLDNTSTVSRIEDGRLIYQQRTHNASDPFLTIPLVARLNRGACAMRCKTQHGALFFNFCSHNTGTSARTLSLNILDGNWNLIVQRQDLEDKVWKRGQSTALASSPIAKPTLAKDEWLDVAFRWSEKDYGVWLDGQLIAGGTLPSDELAQGPPQPVQIGLRTAEDRLPKLEIDFIGLWDQSELSLGEARVYGGSRQ